MKTADVPVPQILHEVAEVVKAVKNDVPTPQILEEIVEASSAPHERVQQRTIVEVATVRNVPQERIPEGIGVQMVTELR